MEQQTLAGFDTEETLAGVVESVIFAAPSGGFAVFRLTPDHESGRVNVTVQSEAPLVGQQVALKGHWVVHPKFGRQFRAEHLIASAPTSADGIERFLASGVIDGIGPALARRIVQRFGAETLDILEQQPARLAEIPGVGSATAKKAAASYQAQSELRDIMIWLEEHGISGTFAARIFKQYGSFALDVLEHHPYRLAAEVSGIGFLTADALAKRLGVEADSPVRLRAGLDYALSRIALSGHCCIPEAALIERAAKVLSAPHEAVRDALSRGIEADYFAVESIGGETLVYPPLLYDAECRTAELLRYLAGRADQLTVGAPDALVADWEARAGLRLAAGQRAAIEGALTSGILVLTGGPGTGKTTVVRGMIELLERQGLTILLGAPTGRAAKRLSEATGRKAVTVHRMLEAQGGAQAMFAKDEDEQLEADVIILDEVSMMDIVLMRHFLEAVPAGCHLILVGDVDQLPAVGPGAVLKDILRSGVIPSVCLTEVFRQDEASRIVLNAHAINQGRLPECAEDGDFRFYELPDAEATADRIVDLCARELPAEGYSPLADIQVLSPMHRQECGVDSLNRRLQAALNPPSPAKSEYTNSVLTLRLGDKVMQTKNNYQKRVFNGDIGYIRELEADHLTVRFAEETVDYERAEIGELTLAYAMSVHKSQGSEYPVIVLPLVPGHRIMLQRNLLYTAVTRAKSLVILLGSKAALQTAVENDRTKRRYTLLAERLAQAL